MKKVIKIAGWNINGINSIIKKGKLSEYISQSEPDIICLSETRITNENLEKVDYYNDLFEGIYPYCYWNCSETKKGYAGTAILSKIKPKKYSFFHEEGRITFCEFDNFKLVSLYAPNAGENLERLDYKVGEWSKYFRKVLNKIVNKKKSKSSIDEFLDNLDILKKSTNKNKGVILVGDFNVAREDIDVYSLLKLLAGCTKEERDDFERLINEFNLTDIFRSLNPNSIKFTFWSNRQFSRIYNRGVRLDYFLVDDYIKSITNKCIIRDDVKGSDHCPIELILKNDFRNVDL